MTAAPFTELAWQWPRASGKSEYMRQRVLHLTAAGKRVLVCCAAGDLDGRDWLDLNTTANHDPGDEDVLR